MKFWTCLILWIAWAGIVKGNTKHFFETMSPESGFAFNAITSITEDGNGFVWFCTENAIYYHNTSETREYTIRNDSSANSALTGINRIYNDDS